MSEVSKPIRGSVNGENKYVRIPIRRHRTPILKSEIKEIGKILGMLDNDVDTLGRIACLISDLGMPCFAGKIFSYIDYLQGKEVEIISFVKEEGGIE